MASALDMVIQVAMFPVALAMIMAIVGLFAFAVGFCRGFWNDITRGMSNLWLFLWAERELDREEKWSRKVAALAAARRRRPDGNG